MKLGIPVCHLESGLRSFDWSMPEEHNRRLTDHVSTLLLTHSQDGNDNLAAEGVSLDHVALVGNTMIDTLLDNVGAARELEVWRDYGVERRGYVLVTLHRPALVDVPELLAQTMVALERVARELPVVFPVHPRTRSRIAELGIEPSRRLILADPQPYGPFLCLEAEAAAVITDSGGVQEETTALGVPCFTLRNNTERPVTVTHGTNTLIGLDPTRIDEIPRLLEQRQPSAIPPFWDGLAGKRAADVIAGMLEELDAVLERRARRPASAAEGGGAGAALAAELARRPAAE